MPNIIVLVKSLATSYLLLVTKKRYLGGYSSGVPPLPIPNREVKPTRADGTALHRGRVGRRRFSETSKIKFFGVSLFLESLFKRIDSLFCMSVGGSLRSTTYGYYFVRHLRSLIGVFYLLPSLKGNCPRRESIVREDSNNL